jgi:RNA polymerase sigma-70 factor (ECF subfamily)
MPKHTDQLVDEILVLDCQSGSREALDLLFSRWHSRLLRHAYYITGDSDAAWEVAQGTWLGVVRGISRLDDPAKFAPWVFRIATNRSRDWISQRRKARRLSDLPPETPNTDDDEIARSDTTLDVHDVLEMLPEESRTVLNLYYIEHLGVPEVASALAIPAGTVKSRMHAAREAFKRIWISRTRHRQNQTR